MGYKVFISYKHTTMDGSSVTQDYTIASDLHRTLTRAGVPTFFSEKDLSTGDFINEIYDALEEADILIVVGTKSEHIRSKWVKEEWSTFVAEINGGRKPHGDVYTYLAGMTVNDLPSMLYKRQSYATGEKEKLVERITKQLGIKHHAASAPPSEPASQSAQQMQPAPKPQVKVGDVIPFGQYPQGAGGEVQPLMWRVLDVQGGKALLITDKLIDCKCYNKKYLSVTWADCTLRKWLQNEFMQEAFSRAEQEQIVTVVNQNPKNPQYGTEGGKPTQDKIFLLSIEEADRYFRSNEDRMAAVTAYGMAAVKKRGSYVIDNYSLASGEQTGWWWLRSPGFNRGYAASVSYHGIISEYNYVIINNVSVRPAFWLNLS